MSTVIVTSAQVAAAKLIIKRGYLGLGAWPSDATFAIANASKTSAPKKVSGNMIHARELDINAVTTVSELFELIDLPYRVTKHAQLSIVTQSRFGDVVVPTTLRLEWRGEPE